MEKYLNKFYEIIEKIGKQNFILIVFILIILIVTGLYQTFSLYTETEGLSVIDGINTYKFILNSNNSTNSVTIAAGSSKNLDITVSNTSEITLAYGIYYSSSSSLTNVALGYLSSTSALPTGTISAKSDNIVTMKINNFSASNITINFGLKYGFENGGNLGLDTGQYWVEEYTITTAAQYVQNLYNDGSSITNVNIANDSTKPTVFLNYSQEIMLDNNGDYRYYGKNPSNYVLYNDELWRIISVGNVKSNINDATGETRVKIVKADVLKDDNNLSAYSYDSSISTINSGSGVNDWSTSDLMSELNTLYYYSGSGVCYTGSSNATTACDFTNTGLSEEARNLTEDAVYYLGGGNTYYGYPNEHYINERGTNVYPSTTSDTCNDGSCPRATTWVGRIGIIYPSDYLYAADLITCVSDGTYYSNSNCSSTNWLLYTGEIQRTISQYAGNSSLTQIISTNGNITIPSNSSDAYVIRPVQYLKSNVVITGGSGTSNVPYTLALA